MVQIANTKENALWIDKSLLCSEFESLYRPAYLLSLHFLLLFLAVGCETRSVHISRIQLWSRYAVDRNKSRWFCIFHCGRARVRASFDFMRNVKKIRKFHFADAILFNYLCEYIWFVCPSRPPLCDRFGWCATVRIWPPARHWWTSKRNAYFILFADKLQANCLGHCLPPQDFIQMENLFNVSRGCLERLLPIR